MEFLNSVFGDIVRSHFNHLRSPHVARNKLIRKTYIYTVLPTNIYQVEVQHNNSQTVPPNYEQTNHNQSSQPLHKTQNAINIIIVLLSKYLLNPLKPFRRIDTKYVLVIVNKTYVASRNCINWQHCLLSFS